MRAAKPGSASVPIPLRLLAHALDASDDYEVLRRALPIERWEPRHRVTGEIKIGVLGVVTTGSDLAKDRIIEFAIQQITIDGEGRIVETARPHAWLEDPGFPISPEIAVRTGIGDVDVKGRAVSEEEAYSLLHGSDVLMAHDAAFHRPFVDRRFDAPGKAWICSMRDIDWHDQGFECDSLGCLTRRSGWFRSRQGAVDSVGGLVRVLDQRLPSGDTVMRELFRNALRPTFLVEAPDTPAGTGDLMRGRGYRWDAWRALRWRRVSQDMLDAEVAWLVNEVYAGRRGPEIVRQTWRERYSLRERGAA